MKKTAIALAAILGICVLGFMALLVGTGPDDAPSAPVVVDLPDTYER